MTKIIINTFFVLLCSLSTTVAQVTNWTWAKSVGGSGNESAYSLSTDLNGDVYAAGIFRNNSIVLGSDTFSTFYPRSFLVKYNASGNFLWAKSPLGHVDDASLSSTTDNFGNTYLAGTFYSADITFDSIILNLDSTSSDIFIAKYDSDGHVLWAKRAGGTLGEQALSITTDASGNVYIGGLFSSSPFEFGSDTLNCSASYDMFLAKYDSSGIELWAKSLGSNASQARSLKTDIFGNVYVTGTFWYPLIFGSDTLTSSGNWWQSFLLKYDSSGNQLWAKSPTSTNENRATSIGTDQYGNVYTGGWFRGTTITFGSIILNNFPNGYDDLFLIKYDSSGNVQWGTSAGGNGHDEVLSLAIDGLGKVYITGFFESPSISFGTFTLTKPGIYDAEVFLVKYENNGTVLWAKKASGSWYDWGQSVTTDNSGSVFVGGYFGSSSLAFGSIVLNNVGVLQTTDMFVAKMGGSVGIDEINNESSLIIFPNPTNTSLNLTGNRTKRTVISNILGKIVLQKDISTNTQEKVEIDVSHISPGIYFIKVGSEVKQFIKQ